MPRLAVASAPTSDTPSVRCSCGATNFASATPITRGDEPHPDRVGDRHREQDDGPCLHALGAVVGKRAEDEQRDAGAERHLREVEGELDRPLAAVHGERDGGAGDLRGQQVGR